MVPGTLKLQPEPVDDPADRRVADFFALNDPDLRRHGFFLAEGAWVIRQLLRSPYPVRAVLGTSQALARLADDLADLDAPVYVVDQALMTSITGFHFHRGVLASAERLPHPDLGAVASGARLLLLAEGVSDNENLGGLFRNAAGLGVGAVLLDPTCADPLYRRSVRVSVGQVLHVPFTVARPWPAAIARLRNAGFEVLALTPSPDAEDIRSVERRPRQALLVGSEGRGLSGPAMAAADRRVRITMAPGVDSLNVATAAAVALHRLVRPG